VLKWIGKILGGPDVEVPAGVPAPWVEQVEALLGKLEKTPVKGARSGISRDMLMYTLHGEPLSVLQELSQNAAIGEKLGINGYLYGNKSISYEAFGGVPVDIALRWARLLTACVASNAHYSLQIPNGVHWPEVLMMHSTGNSLTGYSSQRPKAEGLSAEMIERMLMEDGVEPSALIKAAFATPINSGYGVGQRLLLVSDLDGYANGVARHIDAVLPLLMPADVQQRLHVLAMLEKVDASTLNRMATALCELAVASSKQVRAAAEPLVRRAGQPVVDSLKTMAAQGKPEQRVNALRLIWKIAGEKNDEALRSYARDTASADKAPSAQALVGEWDSAQSAAVETEVQFEYTQPQIDWSGALTPAVSKLLKDLWRELNDSVAKANKQSRDHHQQMQSQGRNFPLHVHDDYSADEFAALSNYLASDQPRWTGRKQDRQRSWRHAGPAIVKLATADGMTPIVMFKLLNFVGLMDDNDSEFTHYASGAFNALHRSTGRPALLELSAIVEAGGYSAVGLLRTYCYYWGSTIAKDWKPSTVWPFFAHNIDLLAQSLISAPIKDYRFDRGALFRAVETLPKLPSNIVNALFALALGPGKTERLAAQAALTKHAGKESRIVEALSDGKSDARAVAATWLAQLRYQPAVPAIEKALQDEKHDVAKGAMLDALQAFGQPVEKYLDRTALATEAAKSVAKGLPKDIEWFPWSALPEVRWADSKESVPSDIVRWMLVQAVKQKSPEPNAVLRKYCAMFEPRDREALGQFVLETWLREDVRPIPAEEAMKLATSSAQSTYGSMQSYPQYYKESPMFGRSVEELIALMLPGCLRQPAGSLIASKGVLAVAAACAADRAAAPVARYLKEYYGTRAAQGKSLISMLAWIDHPTATQLMLAIGNRFRTKSFQEEATKQAQALADRKGWTLSELADRTIPSAGFDETSTLELSYGQRSFTAKLLADFKIELFNPDGKKIASLPEPRQDDDAEVAKDSKKAFSTAKKEIKSIVELQTDRLYEALCTERDWTFEDWSLYLNQHPVVRHLVQRLVWAQVVDGRVVKTFRPLDDGTLTDREDNEIKLTNDDRVRVAHDSLLAADEVAQWQQHLVDYKIVPLFQQLGKGTYALPAGKAHDTSIKEFEGYLLEAFALRGRSLKLGYTRGAAEDGGWFHVYEKRFPTLGLVAVIEFTGNPLPEENRTVALLNLSFATSGDKSWERGQLPLNKVPKILLSECYNDLRLIAAEGSGFDSNWQKKTEY